MEAILLSAAARVAPQQLQMYNARNSLYAITWPIASEPDFYEVDKILVEENGVEHQKKRPVCCHCVGNKAHSIYDMLRAT